MPPSLICACDKLQQDYYDNTHAYKKCKGNVETSLQLKATPKNSRGSGSLAALSYDGRSIADFMNKIFLKLNSNIIAGKDEISLTELTLALMLNSLPNRFAAVRARLEQYVKNFTIINVRSKLKEEEQFQNLRANEGFSGSVNFNTNPTCPHN